MSCLPNQPCGAHTSVLQTCPLKLKEVGKPVESFLESFLAQDDYPESLLKEKPMTFLSQGKLYASLILILMHSSVSLHIKTIFEGFKKQTRRGYRGC